MPFTLRCLIALCALALTLSACSTATPTAAPTIAPTATHIPIPSVTPIPTLTPTATNTPLPTETPPATQTPVPTTDPVLASARLLGVSWQEHYNLMLTIQFTDAVTPEDYTVMVEDEEYQCQQLEQFPARLYCIGRGRNVYDYANVQIFQRGSDTPGFQGRISIPWFQ